MQIRHMHTSYYRRSSICIFRPSFNKFLYIRPMRALSGPTYVPISKSQLRIDPQKILRLLGDQESAKDAHTLDLVEKHIGESLLTCSPQGAFVLGKAQTAPGTGSIQIPGATFHTGKIIERMLKKAEYYAFFLVTAGPAVESMARSLISEGHYLEGYIVDLAASALVDQATDLLQEQVKNLAKEQGMRITNRYSPGYCSWDVEEQQKLFGLFPEGCCGISLSSSSLMHPIKSISGIIGIGSAVNYQKYTCEICSMKNCHFRQPLDQ